MQSDPDKNDWQQPPQQPSPAPYAAPTEPHPPVSLTPNEDPPAAGWSTPDVAPNDAPQAPVATNEEPVVAAAPRQPADKPVRWQAHEYIHHKKSPVWFIIFAVVVILLIAAAIFLLQAVTFAILIPVMAAALLVYSHRPPRVLNYTLSRQGLHINDHLYPFAQFKGFGVIRDGDEYSVMLLPTKRFQPGVSVYFPEESGEAIVDMLGTRLPMRELHLDAIDKIVRKLRI
jgi:hypothetical protein